jgi:outer membrane protein insertion porin family
LISISSYAENVISKINIEGLRNVEEKYILSKINIRNGTVYSQDLARSAVRSIIGLGCFDGCRFTFEKGTGVFTFVVVEKPYIENVVFRGNDEFSKNKLRSVSALKEKDFYDVLNLQESKKQVMKLYNDKGYADCSVEVYPTLDVDTNRMTITFLITENKKVLIGGVKIEGSVAYSEKKILNLIKKTKPDKIFKDEDYQYDLLYLEAFYKHNGFVDYKLIASKTSFNEDRSRIFLTLNINEGIRYKIGSISFAGNFVFENKNLEKMLKFKKGQIFNEQKIIETTHQLSEFYADKGYLQIQIIPEFHKNGNMIDIKWNITENSIVYVRNIYIEGLESTKEKVIRRELLLKRGGVFSRRKLIESVQRVRNLGFIDNIEYHLLPAGASDDVVDLSFKIEEGGPGTVNGGVAYSSRNELFFTLGLTHMNLFGLGQHLNLSAEYGKKKTNFNINWTDPYIFNKNASLTLNAFNIIRKKDYAEINDAYDEHKTGFSIASGPRICSRISSLFGYRYENVVLSHIDDSIKGKISEASDLSKGRTTSLFAQMAYDSLDYKYDPTRGNRQALGIKVAGSYLGGDVNYIRTIFKSSWFFPLFWKFVFDVKFEIGSIVSYGSSKSVPIYERFYIGGPESVRGYKYRTEIGPANGGNFKTVVNFEYKCPLLASDKGKSILVGMLFYDVGGSWENGETLEWFGTDGNNLHSSAGVELRVTTPILPVRIGLAHGFNHKDKVNPRDSFYFCIGIPF